MGHTIGNISSSSKFIVSPINRRLSPSHRDYPLKIPYPDPLGEAHVICDLGQFTYGQAIDQGDTLDERLLEVEITPHSIFCDSRHFPVNTCAAGHLVKKY